jgi:hypothetical protein
MPAVSLTTLRARALHAADQTGSDFVPTDRLDEWLNRALSDLHEKLIGLFEDYAETVLEATFPQGVETYALPSDFLKLLGIDVYSSSGKWLPMGKFTQKDRARLRNAEEFSSSPEDVRYRLKGLRTLELRPKPGQAVTAEILYVPSFTYLTAPSDTCEFPHGWEERAVLEAAIKCVDKEERPTDALQRRLTVLDAQILEAASERDQGEPDRVQDVLYRSATPRRSSRPE